MWELLFVHTLYPTQRGWLSKHWDPWGLQRCRTTGNGGVRSMWLPQGCEEHLSLFIFAGNINHVRNPFYTENISRDIYIYICHIIYRSVLMKRIYTHIYIIIYIWVCTIYNLTLTKSKFWQWCAPSCKTHAIHVHILPICLDSGNASFAGHSTLYDVVWFTSQLGVCLTLGSNEAMCW